ncbi:branched-chain amino acid aminotransferase [Alterisphingorhabdus coralli]|uniref:Branched-chain-amino-acid aminotransferase n=1 Tax=Alterisphingorhabdus coralli TaxID=3071408 RepID=A0AA97F9P2_9SPHN|nr:branched-chain amino acid aminotransferase [Parasphingorhabdus sp. SCSIO 66989]WOE76101.1 branched-chain amino acid aminotransferase [Parasphingorhabdus sp. SCSIO 66989]
MADTLDFGFHPNPDPMPADERAERLKDPGFGTLFTDHMAMVRYTEGKGWHDAEISARRALSLDPAAAVLHYAQEIFEGMKAYKQADGAIALFRPEENARRFQRSAERMAMPELPEQIFLDSITRLTEVERDWIPPQEGGALYLRPFMFASEAFLGVRPAKEYLYLVIACSVGSYFKADAPAVTIWASQNYSRAAPGGTGAAKCGGNYAASLPAQAEAIEAGCDQVVFLDAAEKRWVEELGGMNLFFVFDNGEVVTPPLTGTILPGITRASLIQLLRDEGLTVREEPYAFEDWRKDSESGRLLETMACGTAAVVTAVGTVKSADGDFTIGTGGPGQITRKMRDRLVNIQRGEAPDPHGWVKHIG